MAMAFIKIYDDLLIEGMIYKNRVYLTEKGGSLLQKGSFVSNLPILIKVSNEYLNHSMNISVTQPINECLNYSMNISMAQPINECLNHSMNISITQSIAQSLNERLNQSMNDHSLKECLNQSMNASSTL
jgi:hypothetical protein